MAAQKNFIDINLAILAHKFSCPYYSPNSEGLSKPTTCGAYDVANQHNCTGDCWYMKEFRQLLNELKDE